MDLLKRMCSRLGFSIKTRGFGNLAPISEFRHRGSDGMTVLHAVLHEKRVVRIYRTTR